MRFKSVRFFAVLFSLFFGAGFHGLIAFATVTVSPVSPYENIDNKDIVYFAAQTSGSSKFMDSDFKEFDFSKTKSTESSGSRTNMLQLEVKSDGFTSTDSLIVQVTAKSGSSQIKIPIAFAGDSDCSESNCIGTAIDSSFKDPPTLDKSNNVYYFAAKYTQKSTIKIGIYVQDICYAANTHASGKPTVDGCGSNGSSNDTFSIASTESKNITLTFNVGTPKGTVNHSNDASEISTGAESKMFNLYFQGGSPTLSPCPSLNEIYFPGDGEILLNAKPFENIAKTHGNTPPHTLLVVAKKGGDPQNLTSSSFATSNDIVSRLKIADGEQAVGGFTNTTDGNDNKYNIAFMVRDAAGVISNADSNCALQDVQTSQIQGFVGKSNCFIASAAFRDGDAPPVQLLRTFRDRVLLQFRGGKQFVRWYYKNSPKAARWLIEHPFFRFPVLLFLVPLQIFAWLMLHPLFLLPLCLLSLVVWGGCLMGRRGLRAGLPVLLLFFCDATVRADEISVQPYLDQIKQSMSQESQTEDSFIDSERAKMQEAGTLKKAPSKGYTQRLQQRILEEDREKVTESYTEQEKLKIKETGAERESAITALKEGRSELRAKKAGKIKGAFGFALSASANREVTGASDVISRSYTDFYGNAWVPELRFLYEYQPFHWEWFGNLGLVGGIGVSFQSAKGQFQYVLFNKKKGENFSQSSNTEFNFYTVPLTAGLNFRLNLLRLIRPYIQFGPAAVLYMETRSDTQTGSRGNSRGTLFSAGVNLLLDWMMPKSSWDLYEEFGFKKAYLTVDFSKLKTTSGVVHFSNSITSIGLTYEF